MMRRRTFLHGAAVAGAAAMLPRRAMAAVGLGPPGARHDRRRTLAKRKAHLAKRFLIESSDPELHGLDAMVRSYVDYLYALA